MPGRRSYVFAFKRYPRDAAFQYKQELKPADEAAKEAAEAAVEEAAE